MDVGIGGKSEYFEHSLVVSLTLVLSLMMIGVKLGLPWLLVFSGRLCCASLNCHVAWVDCTCASGYMSVTWHGAMLIISYVR